MHGAELRRREVFQAAGQGQERRHWRDPGSSAYTGRAEFSTVGKIRRVEGVFGARCYKRSFSPYLTETFSENDRGVETGVGGTVRRLLMLSGGGHERGRGRGLRRSGIHGHFTGRSRCGMAVYETRSKAYWEVPAASHFFRLGTDPHRRW